MKTADTALPQLDTAWYESRQQLHARYEQLCGLIDCVHLAYLHGAPRELGEGEVADVWRSAIAEPRAGSPTRNSLYIHVPFCKSLCTFCNYERLQPTSPRLLEDWLQRVLASIATLGPAVRELEFHALYVGGGTPSVLPPPLLERLCQALEREFRWHAHSSRLFEFDPAVMSRERFEVLVRHSFKKFSFGVQTLDPNINERHNRGRQSLQVVSQRFDELAALDMRDVACDVLLGLEGTTPAQLLADIETLMARFRPHRIDVYYLTPTEAYVNRHFDGDLEAFERHVEQFRLICPPALDAIAARHDFTSAPGHSHYLVLKDERARGEARSAAEAGDWSYAYTTLTATENEPVHVLGLGPSARSQIFGYATLQAVQPEGGVGEFRYRGQATGREAEIRSYLLHRLRDHDTVKRADFVRLFGVDFEVGLSAALAAWLHQGLVRVDAEGLALVAQQERERRRTLLWLVPDEFLEYELGKRLGLDLTPESLVRFVKKTPRVGPYDIVEAHGPRLALVARDSGRRFTFRVAPRLDDTRGVRVVLESSAPADERGRAQLTHAAFCLCRPLDFALWRTAS